MPLDGTDLFENPALAKLNRVERLLATEQRWCKGRLRDAEGRRCLIEAIAAVDGRQELARPIIRAAREVSGKRYWRIESFNDDPRTTHRDVLRVLQRARESMVIGITASREARPWGRRLVEALRWRFPRDHPVCGQSVCPVRVEDHPRAVSQPLRVRETSAASW
jgi:hypothetical protein